MIYWNITIIFTVIVYISEILDENCLFKDSGGDVSIHHCSDGYEKFKVITVVDHRNHMIKEDDLVDSFTEFKTSPEQQFNPKPKPAEYLKGNSANNLLGVMLFRYFYKRKATMELEFVHRNFLPISKDFPYMVTHIHTDIKYSVQSPTVAISNVINKITQNIKSVT